METQVRELEAAPLGLNGDGEEDALTDFDGAWCADLTPERVPFRIRGKDAWIEVRLMPEKAYNAYVKMASGGGKVRMDLKSQTQTMDVDFDPHVLQTHLLTHSLVAWDFAGETSPEDARRREEAVRSRFGEMNPKLFAFIVGHCLRVNGFTEGAAKN